MQVRQRALVAAQAAARARLQPLLDELVDTVHVQTIKDAFKTLERERIDLIICTLAFEDSRMIDFFASRQANGVGRLHSICLLSRAAQCAVGQHG